MRGGHEYLLLGLFLGALIMGVLCGMMPLAVGRKLGRTGEGIAGFALCVVSAFFGGIVVAGPLALVLSLLLVALGAFEGAAAPAGFDSAAHEERVETLRALARARQERASIPVPDALPPTAVEVELAQAIQCGPPAAPAQAIRASAQADSTPG